jgi:hypothetical protein
MEDKAYIVIDDDDQRQRMAQRIDGILTPEGYKVKSFFYNPLDREYWDKDKNLDLKKLINKIVADTKTYHINVIASDYQFSGITINGIDIIHELRNVGLLARTFLYSGNEAKVAEELFSDKLNADAKIQRFTIILKCRIEKFLTRDTYNDMIVESLRKNYTFKEIVLKKMEEYQDVVIAFDAGYFEGRKISDASTEIKNDTLHGNRFISQLLEFSIAHFSNLNKK